MTDAARRTGLFLEVAREMERQDAKFGSQRKHSDLLWLAILTEEVGESAKAILENSNLREELIQVAAVAVQWVNAIDRRKSEG